MASNMNGAYTFAIVKCVRILSMKNVRPENGRKKKNEESSLDRPSSFAYENVYQFFKLLRNAFTLYVKMLRRCACT